MRFVTFELFPSGILVCIRTPIHREAVFRKPLIVSFGVHCLDECFGEEAVVGEIVHARLHPLPVENRLKGWICQKAVWMTRRSLKDLREERAQRAGARGSNRA